MSARSHPPVGPVPPTAPEVERLLQRPDVVALAEQLYPHVFDKLDFEGLYGLEQTLWNLLADLGIDDLDISGPLAEELVDRAAVRALQDPTRSYSVVPFGITKAEERAVDFDETCTFCKVEQEEAEEAKARAEADAKQAAHDHANEPCGLCDDMATAWRHEHAAVLKRHGLAPP